MRKALVLLCLAGAGLVGCSDIDEPAAPSVTTTDPPATTTASPITTAARPSGPQLSDITAVSEWALVAGADGLSIARPDGSTSVLVTDPVRIATAVGVSHIAFQRTADNSPVEILDLRTGALRVALDSVGNSVVRLESAAAIDGATWLLFTKLSASERRLLRLNVDTGEERAVGTLPNGSEPVAFAFNSRTAVGTILAAGLPKSVAFAVSAATEITIGEQCCVSHLATTAEVTTTETDRADVAFITRSASGQQTLALALLLHVDGSMIVRNEYPLPEGVVVRDLDYSRLGSVVVNTWATTERLVPGQPLLLRDKTFFRLGRAGRAVLTRVLDPAPIAGSITQRYVVTDESSVWVVGPNERRQLLDWPARITVDPTGRVFVQRTVAGEDQRRQPIVELDIATGATRPVMLTDGDVATGGWLVMAATIGGATEIFYSRIAPSRNDPRGELMLFRRPLAGGPERAVVAVGGDEWSIDGLHVRAERVLGFVRSAGNVSPIAFDLNGRRIDYVVPMDFCGDTECYGGTPPYCGLEVQGCPMYPMLSPDGSRMAWTVRTANRAGIDLVIVDAATGAVQRREAVPVNAVSAQIFGVSWRGNTSLALDAAYNDLELRTSEGFTIEAVLDERATFAVVPQSGRAVPL